MKLAMEDRMQILIALEHREKSLHDSLEAEGGGPNAQDYWQPRIDALRTARRHFRQAHPA